eukprot:CAMPEP_0177649356 /NCGR_PEP_ID=MMETSP0447-20121125/11340_1 /TAXON_ID=0 /ORGANISM="Stygamoeba regulata, Strain BSH-02190019" /LENGTH=112 /DNA_ID=CAMNT_0019152103 /DNA_START=290 /DNA_END=629 /DNA_ORIENTATION=-
MPPQRAGPLELIVDAERARVRVQAQFIHVLPPLPRVAIHRPQLLAARTQRAADAVGHQAVTNNISLRAVLHAQVVAQGGHAQDATAVRNADGQAMVHNTAVLVHGVGVQLAQ